MATFVFRTVSTWCLRSRCSFGPLSLLRKSVGLSPFTIILRHDGGGVEYQPVTGTVPEIMAELVQMLREQATYALTHAERYRQQVQPNVDIFQVSLEIPASLGSMGGTQMLELLGGTRFSVVEKRLIREGAIAVGTMRVPPPPPTPSGRPSSAPTVRPPPAPPSRGRSPGSAASSRLIYRIALQLHLPPKQRPGLPQPKVQRLLHRPGQRQLTAHSHLCLLHLVHLRRPAPLVVPRSTSVQQIGAATLPVEARFEALLWVMHPLPLPLRQHPGRQARLLQPPEGVLRQGPPDVTTMGVDEPSKGRK